MSARKKILWAAGGGLAGSAFITLVYFTIVSLAESPQHALDLAWQQRWFIVPLIIGFGVQSSLYIILKKRLFIPVENAGPSGALTGAGGAASTTAMVACCAHHAADLLPILGMSAASAFLVRYQTAFMAAGLSANLAGISWMLYVLKRERQKMIKPISSAIPLSIKEYR